MKKLVSFAIIAFIIYAFAQTYGWLPKLKLPDAWQTKNLLSLAPTQQKIVYEESTVTGVIEKAIPSVVTVGISKTITTRDQFQLNPMNPFSPFERIPGQKRDVKQNIGSGFVGTTDGLIITNKHVVSDTLSDYTVLTNDGKKYNVQKIYRDPLNDIAIVKINATGLKPLPLADSSKIKLGQMAIAIGTPLGEFTNTVTTGIVSGLGRGITAGSPYEEFVEKLDNIIQTDAAISPGNSGGPLLNSAGQVMGVNTAVSQEGQNLGFAIPSNIIKDVLEHFNRGGGSFERPYIGVRYKMIDKQSAILNEVVEGAYVIEVVSDSPAEKTGVKAEDIITSFDGKKITGTDDQQLTKAILDKKVGDAVGMRVWRDTQTKDITIKLEASP
jgi:S1-C subfamily serine protease